MSLDVTLILDGEYVYEANITHNLGKMANAADIYKACWRPEEEGWTKAADIIEPLETGLKRLVENPKYYKQFEASNGWGLYKHFVPWVIDYLQACKEYPEATIEVSR